MRTKIQLKNLDCANCARELEEEISKIGGVKSVSVDFMRQSISLEYESEEVLAAVKRAADSFEDVRVVETPQAAKAGAWSEHRAEIIALAFAALCLVAGIVLEYTIAETYFAAEIVSYVLFAAAYLTVGWKTLLETVKNIAHGRIFDENFLMTVASVGAIALGQYAEAAEVMVLYCLGELLQSAAVGSSRRSIAALMDLKSETATVITPEGNKQIPPEEIRKGDILLVRAGEKLAADGVIVKGSTSLDTKSLSGEAMLRDVAEGDEVLGGSINAGGVVEVRAEKDYGESTVAKILELVENSAAKKARSEKFITKFAKIYTPAVCLAALIVAFLVPAFTGNYVANLGTWVNKALVFLVVSCPCALVISVPLSYFSGIGFAAKYGVLVKGSTGLDALAKAKIAAFDKTGTLTYGDFEIAEVYGKNRETVLSVAAAAEKNSSHPLAAAFADIKTNLTAENAKEIAGMGLECEIGGKTALAGNAKLMRAHGVSVPEYGGTLVYVAWGGEYLGCVRIEDRIKENARESLAALKKGGVRACYMLTGDSETRAKSVAQAAGLDGVYAGLLPDEKLKIARGLKERGNLLYVGDGINDAPVLMEADAGVSMGGVGSDAAIEASDVVLMRDDLSLLPFARRTAARTRAIVLQNIVFSIAVKLAVMILGLYDLIPLGLAVFADVGVMMLAVVNSFRTRVDFRAGRKKAETARKGLASACSCGGACAHENDFGACDEVGRGRKG